MKKTECSKKSRWSLRAKLTVFISIIVFAGIFLSHGLSFLIDNFLPFIKLPYFVQTAILSLIIAGIVANFMSRYIYAPIQDLLFGIKKVTDGNFDVSIKNRHSTVETEEIVAKFNLMAKELRSTEILQSDFISNVSHEIKTPISSIEGYVTLLQDTENIDEQQRDYIEKILFSTNQLSSLVNNILLLSKIGSESIGALRAYYSVDEQIRQILVTTEIAWESKNIDLDVDLEETSFYGCAGRLYHVWSNLINNAIKFSPEGGTIKIRLKKEENMLYFTIEDQGPGLSEVTKKHMFDKFYQADSSHKQEGNGLGLALVKQILDTTGDTVDAENVEGGGCKFTVSLNCNDTHSAK